MRLAFYNPCFSCNGRNPISHLLGHIAVHFRSKQEIYERTNINKTVEAIQKVNPDIIGLCEILDFQEKELKDKLKKIGYNYFLSKKGYEIKKSKISVKVALASKVKLEHNNISGFPKINKIGTGGLLRAYIPYLKTTIFVVHLAHPIKPVLRDKQALFLKENIKKIKGPLIMLGDFNMAYKKLKKYIPLQPATKQMKTCYTTFIYKSFYFQDLDHIFARGFKTIKTNSVCCSSDHKLIYADLASKL